MKKIKKQNIVFTAIIAILFFYYFDRFGEAYNTSQAADIFSKLSEASECTEIIIKQPYISFCRNDLLWGICGMGAFILFVLYISTQRSNYRYGEEHGSARWGVPSDLKGLTHRKYENNMLFTQTERMDINDRKTLRNNNILVIGSPGTGKTRFFLKPNLMQMHSSYVITDPKGTVLNECGKMLADAGYVIKTFNTVDFYKSMKYNPFGFIQTEADVKVFVDLLINSTNGGVKTGGDMKFWEDAERLLYMALVGYIVFHLKDEYHNFATLTQLINLMQTSEENESYMNMVDGIFAELEYGTKKFAELCGREEIKGKIIKPHPESFALAQYKKFKLASGKTAKSILVSCGVRLSPFDIKEVKEVTSKDELELGTLGDRKTALFIIIDDKVATFNFLAAFLYSQLFKELCDRADMVYKGRLPVHVRCILDEFANIGQIPDFDKVINIIRSRNVSADVIVQNPAQIKAVYGDKAKSIEGGCDTTLFLGSNENDVQKYISEKAGKTTIDHRGTSTQKGNYGSFTMSDQILGRELITPSEVGLLPNGECLLFIRGVPPFKSKKFNIKSHKNYKYLADYDKKNHFDIVEYNKKLKEKDKAINDFFDEDDSAFEELFD